MIATVPVELTDAALAADLAQGLALVEDQLAEASRAEEELLAEASTHLIDAGGKRFRATLVLLASHFGNPRDERVVPAAAAIELTHLATLYHDDVMDEAAMRRGHPSANSRWTNTIAILTGDFLFARASHLLAQLGPDAVRIQAETFTRLVSGQIAETIGPRPGRDPLEHYLRVVKEKTASLVATAGRFGAMFSGRAGRGGPPDRAGLRGDRGGLAAVRRHPRRGQRIRPVGQDARHRPAGGRAQPPGAARTAVPPPGGRPAAGTARFRGPHRPPHCTPRP